MPENLTESQIRERKSDILNKLARNFSSFKAGQKDDWLNSLEHVTPEQLDRAITRFLEHDPRVTENARQSLPKLADIMRDLPPKPEASYSPGLRCATYGPDGIAFHGGYNLEEMPVAERTRIARWIANYWGSEIHEKRNSDARAAVKMLDPTVLTPKQEVLVNV